MNNLYKDDSIQSLDPRSHVRLRSGMYVGDTQDATQLAIEILGNSIDEYSIGHGDIIYIDIDYEYPDAGQGYAISVRDQGQGFPIAVTREDGETVLQASFDIINTSGKYSNDGVYEGTAIGLNGIGLKLVNFLSHWLYVISYNNKGEYEELSFKEGIFDVNSRRIGKDKLHPSGTKIIFQPSEEFFTNPRVDKKKLRNFCEDITCLCPDLTIVFNGEKIKHDGIQDLLKKLLDNSIPILNSNLVFSKQQGKQKIDLALTYCDKSSSNIVAYVNCGYTIAGPHLTAIKSCLTRTLNKWGKEQGILKDKDKNLEGSALQEGLILACNITADNVAYDAQVKNNITKIDTTFISSAIGEQLELWLDNNPIEGKTIIERALLARKAAEAARKAREAIKSQMPQKTKKKKVFLEMPSTLIDANSKDRSQCELIVVEGLSPASSLVAQRDAMITAIYSVRGMMLNLQKSSEERIMTNKEINNLITALGLDYNSKNGRMIYDKNKLRYDKIIAASDADPAGAEIENLLFNILWHLCPELIINKHVYSAEPPLFKVTTKSNKYIFLADQQALNNYKKAHNTEIATVHRAKGLAEMQPQELASFILDQNTRQLKQITVEDINEADKLFKDLYGKDVPPRVQYIHNNIWGVEVDYE